MNELHEKQLTRNIISKIEQKKTNELTSKGQILFLYLIHGSTSLYLIANK